MTPVVAGTSTTVTGTCLQDAYCACAAVHQIDKVQGLRNIDIWNSLIATRFEGSIASTTPAPNHQ